MSSSHAGLDRFDLTGKTALITGAGGLLGGEHAKALLALGANVVLTDVDDAALLVQVEKLSSTFSKSNIMTQRLDVTDQDNVLQVKEALNAQAIKPNILINNAAIDPKVKNDDSTLAHSRLENFSLMQWDMELNVGLKGAFICSQVFGTQMAKMGGGIILNIASDLSVFSPDQRLYEKAGLSADCQPVKPVTYSVIKTGLIGLTRYLATYWALEGVRANALSPGGVYTGQDDVFVSKLKSLIPQNRMAKVDEYQGAIQFLCSDASAYMNGQNLVMDGGRSVW